jgi:hypothetical protein
MVLWNILDRNFITLLRCRGGRQSAVRICKAAMVEEFEKTGCAGGIGVCGRGAGL